MRDISRGTGQQCPLIRSMRDSVYFQIAHKTNRAVNIKQNPMTYSSQKVCVKYFALFHLSRGVTTGGGKGGTIPRAPNSYGGAESLWGAPKSSNKVTSTFFNAVQLVPKDLRFAHGGAKLASCPGAPSNLVTKVHLKQYFGAQKIAKVMLLITWKYRLFCCINPTLHNLVSSVFSVLMWNLLQPQYVSSNLP